MVKSVTLRFVLLILKFLAWRVKTIQYIFVGCWWLDIRRPVRSPQLRVDWSFGPMWVKLKDFICYSTCTGKFNYFDIKALKSSLSLFSFIISRHSWLLWLAPVLCRPRQLRPLVDHSAASPAQRGHPGWLDRVRGGRWYCKRSLGLQGGDSAIWRGGES